MFISFWVLTATALVSRALAQYFPPKPEGVFVASSRLNPEITISFKETNICETTPGVKGYAGKHTVMVAHSENDNIDITDKAT